MTSTPQRNFRIPSASIKLSTNDTYSTNWRVSMINNKMLNQRDLMKLYVPPLKKWEIPQNNPFFNKSFVQQQDEYAAYASQ